MVYIVVIPIIDDNGSTRIPDSSSLHSIEEEVIKYKPSSRLSYFIFYGTTSDVSHAYFFTEEGDILMARNVSNILLHALDIIANERAFY